MFLFFFLFENCLIWSLGFLNWSEPLSLVLFQLRLPTNYLKFQIFNFRVNYFNSFKDLGLFFLGMIQLNSLKHELLHLLGVAPNALLILIHLLLPQPLDHLILLQVLCQFYWSLLQVLVDFQDSLFHCIIGMLLVDFSQSNVHLGLLYFQQMLHLSLNFFVCLFQHFDLLLCLFYFFVFLENPVCDFLYFGCFIFFGCLVKVFNLLVLFFNFFVH